VMVGRSLLALKRWNDARSAFDAVVALDPEHALISVAQSGAIEALYYSEAFAEVAERAEYITPRLTGATRQRVVYLHALSEMKQAHDAAAIAQFRALLDLKPDAALADQARLLIGQCAARKGALADALSWFDQVLASDRADLHGEARLASADANYRLGRRERALADVQAVLAGDDDPRRKARAAYLQSRLDFDAQDYPAAIAALRIARAGDGAEQDELAYWSAKCALRRGEPDSAAKQFAEMIKTYPNSALVEAAQYDRAVALLESGEAGDARSAFARFVKLHPRHELAPNALHLLAEAARRDDDPEACSARCAEFAKRYSDHARIAEVILLAGQCAADAEDWPVAMDRFDSFAERFADDARSQTALYQAGLAAYRLERFDAARERFEGLIQGETLPPEFVNAALALGDMAYQRGEWTRAERWFSKYLERVDDVVGADDALLKRGIARRQRDQPESALADFDALLKRFPKSLHRARAQLERGQVLAALGHTQEAAEALANVAGDGESDSLAVLATFQRGVLAMRAERYADAVSAFSKLIDGDGVPADQRAEARYQRAQCHIALGAFDAAQEDLRALRKEHAEHPRSASASAWAVIVLARQDQPAEALTAFADLSESVRGMLDRGDPRDVDE
jgi:TolA-binding protein